MADVNPNALNNLADALCKDIARTSDQELLAEAAEDYGDPRAPARAFDRAHLRARRQVQASRATGRFEHFLSWCQSVLTLQFIPARPAMAGLATAVVAIVAVVIAQDVFTDHGYAPPKQINFDGSVPDGTATDRQPLLLGVSRTSARAAINLGDQLLAQGRMDEAVNAYNKGVLEFRQLAARDSTNVTLQQDLSATYGKLGDVLAHQVKREEALRAYQTRLAYARMLAEHDPDNSELQAGVMESLYRVSTVSDSATARILLTQALAIAETLERKHALPVPQSNWPQIIREAIARLN
jgi:tetratricopeptide (TPR) repeat protein